MKKINRDKKKARNILATILAMFILLDTLYIAWDEDVVVGVVRVGLTISLSCFLILGYKVAQWVFVILASVGAVLALRYSLDLFFEERVLFGLAFVLMFCIYFSVGAYVGFSKNLNRYFKAIRYNRKI